MALAVSQADIPGTSKNRPVPHGQTLRRMLEVQFPAAYVQGEKFGSAVQSDQLSAHVLGFRKVFGVVVLGQDFVGAIPIWKKDDQTLRLIESTTGAPAATVELAGASAHAANGKVFVEVIGI